MQNTNTAREAPLRSFRITVPEPAQSGVAALLEAEGFRFEPEPFSACCRRLTAEPRPLGSSLAAFFGLIYIQDRSSMLPPLALARGARQGFWPSSWAPAASCWPTRSRIPVCSPCARTSGSAISCRPAPVPMRGSTFLSRRGASGTFSWIRPARAGARLSKIRRSWSSGTMTR